MRYLRLRYLAPFVLAMTFLAACGGPPTPTPLPFALFGGQQVVDTLVNAGLSVENPQRDNVVGRDAPNTFGDRIVFEIDKVAPLGGQILVFDNEAGLQAWQAYIESLRRNSSTRRDVIYTYVQRNILLQLSANLLPDQAHAYQAALEALG